MASTNVETSLMLDVSRHLPVSAFVDSARANHASGVVDQIHVWDQLTSWWPRDMWTDQPGGALERQLEVARLLNEVE